MFETQYDKIKQHASDEYPNESCGLILKDTGYLPCLNIHPDLGSAFRIKPELLIEHRGNIESVIHSHPNGFAFPSEADMRGQIDSALPWGITTVIKGEASDPFFFGDTAPKQELIGRGFRHGVSDCYSLIRDYYHDEFQKTIPEIPRNWEWWNNGKDLYQDFLESAGFQKFEVGKNPQKGDICFFAIKSKVPNHAGIYLGNNLVLHHPCAKYGVDFSSISYREPIARRIRYVKFWARYKEFI